MNFTSADVQLLRDAANVFNPDLDDIHDQLEDLADRIDTATPLGDEPPDLTAVEAAILALVPTRDRSRLLPQIDRIMRLIEAAGEPNYNTEEGYTKGVDPR